MVTLTKHATLGPDLHSAVPLVLSGFLHCNIFLPNISMKTKKVLLSEGEALALCHMANPALLISLRP